MLLFMAMGLWEYETRGYVSVYGHTFYGADARIVAWLPFLGSLGFLVFYTLLLLLRLRTRAERERYAKEIPDEPAKMICVRCCEPFFVSAEEPASCPKCRSTEIEELSGFFERHPDKRANCPS